MLHDGLVPDATFTAKRVVLRTDWQSDAVTAHDQRAAEQGLELVFRLDPGVLDGRFANNGWLQEVPKPITKLTWDNAALVSPATAKRLGLANEDVVQLTASGRTLQAPVWVVPGQADDSITLSLGYGRTRAGRVGNGVGVDANLIRTSDALIVRVEVKAVPDTRSLRRKSTTAWRDGICLDGAREYTRAGVRARDGRGAGTRLSPHPTRVRRGA